jgi:exopolysaccharide biosynthesis polyprenyl glycosylphosphotransferase
MQLLGRARVRTPAQDEAAQTAGVLATRHRRRDLIGRRSLVVADCIGIVVTILVAVVLHPSGGTTQTVLWAVPVLPLWALLFKLYGLYDRDTKRVSHTTVDDLPWLFHALVVGGLLFWLYAKAIETDRPEFVEMIIFGVLGLVLISSLRAVARGWTNQRLPAERVLFIEQTTMTPQLVRKMRQHPEYGLEPVGVVTTAGREVESELPVLGDVSNLVAVAAAHQVDRLVVSSEHLDEREQLDIFRRCRQLSLKVSVLPQLFEALGPAVAIDDLEGVTMLGVNPPLLSRSSRAMKRALDVSIAALALLALSPFLLAIAIAIRIDSRGPTVYRSPRVGRLGKIFHPLKFRTMVQNADELRAQLMSESKDPGWLHLDDDPRITRVGNVLRMTSLDELPQLWNVLKGEMSLVGPRPLIQSEADMIPDGWGRTRAEITPGLTGLWQVLGRTSIPFDEMVKLDYVYVTNWSLWGDVRLLLRTVPAVLFRRGAN